MSMAVVREVWCRDGRTRWLLDDGADFSAGLFDRREEALDFARVWLGDSRTVAVAPVPPLPPQPGRAA